MGFALELDLHVLASVGNGPGLWGKKGFGSDQVWCCLDPMVLWIQIAGAQFLRPDQNILIQVAAIQRPDWAALMFSFLQY